MFVLWYVVDIIVVACCSCLGMLCVRGIHVRIPVSSDLIFSFFVLRSAVQWCLRLYLTGDCDDHSFAYLRRSSPSAASLSEFARQQIAVGVLFIRNADAMSTAAAAGARR